MSFMSALIQALSGSYSISYTNKQEELTVAAPNKEDVKEIFEQEAIKLKLMEEPNP